MPMQKKHGKGRLDKWYKLAKEKGYRARAAFKLIQLNKKFNGFLEKSKVLLDLCAAPGSWCQVAAEAMPVNSIIIGVDLAPIKPIPKVITFQADITTDKCRATIRQHLKTWKADTVLHDGAPNVGTAWVQDSFNQAELALQAMKLATEFLIEGGTFVTKVFRSKDYNSLLWVFKQLFTKVEATKPPSSRNVSAEIFVVCRGFKAPKHIDPRFLDPKAVFEELANPTPNNEAKVYKPEVKKRKRDGYEEGDYTLYKEIPASEFIQTADPIAILGTHNKLTFEQPKNGDVALAALDKLPETTAEIRTCCADLRVLGRKEFKLLLRWRLRVREIFGFPTKKTAKTATLAEEVAQVDTMDEEMRIQQELQDLKDKANSKKKREKRRLNEQRQKEIVRMQLNMTAPMEIGMEQSGPLDEGSMFALKSIDQTEALRRIARGKMATFSGAAAAAPEQKKDHDSGIGSSGETDDETDEDGDQLERELDGMYEEYQERKAAADAKYRAKKARQQDGDDEFEGFSASDKEDVSDSDGDLEEDSDSEDIDGDELSERPLITDLDNEPAPNDGLSKRARSFFNQDIFKDIAGILDEPAAPEDEEMAGVEEAQEAEEEEVAKPKRSAERVQQNGAKKKPSSVPAPVPPPESDSEDDGFEAVKRNEDEDDWEEHVKSRSDGRPNIDIITAEAMTLAHALARGERTNHDVVDDGFNKHAFRDRDGLPEWFLDDETRHDRPQRPITKEAAAAIREKLRALNARPIKKVREAKARKKFKAAQRLEKLKKKSALLAADEGMTEKEKADSISKLLARAARKTPRQPTKVVVARGANRGIKSRPKGVKGRYKMVDPRMKKETRALKRIAQKQKR